MLPQSSSFHIVIVIVLGLGTNYTLHTKTKDRYTIYILQDGSEFDFELVKEKEVINNEFIFNHMLDIMKQNENNEVILNFTVRIKGRIILNPANLLMMLISFYGTI